MRQKRKRWREKTDRILSHGDGGYSLTACLKIFCHISKSIDFSTHVVTISAKFNASPTKNNLVELDNERRQTSDCVGLYKCVRVFVWPVSQSAYLLYSCNTFAIFYIIFAAYWWTIMSNKISFVNTKKIILQVVSWPTPPHLLLQNLAYTIGVAHILEEDECRQEDGVSRAIRDGHEHWNDHIVRVPVEFPGDWRHQVGEALDE